MDEIHSDYDAYSINDLVCGSKNPTSPSGNGIMFTAEKLLILRDNKALTIDDRNSFRAAYQTQCCVEPGLLRRNLTNNDQEGPDDYVGVASAGNPYAREILNYGRTHTFHWEHLSFDYDYENENIGNQTDVRAWLERFPQVIAHFQYAAGETPNLFRRLAWFISVAATGRFASTSSQDSWRLSYLLVRTAPKRFSTRLATWLFYRRLKDKCGSMRSIYAAYFNDANHPHSKWSKY